MGKRRGLGLMVCMLMVMLSMAAGSKTHASEAKAQKIPSAALKKVVNARQVTGAWVQKGQRRMLQLSDGTFVRKSWVKLEGKIYYLNKKGTPLTGWVVYRGKYYYLQKPGGELLRESWVGTKKRFYVGKNGVRAAGRRTIDGQEYYFSKKTGKKQTGMVKLGGRRYYFQKGSGVMAKSQWVESGGKTYYAGAGGALVTSSWLILKEGKYYLDAAGARVTGEQYIDGKWYYFRKNGVYDPKKKVTDGVDPGKPMVALTFDDGPGPYTMRLLSCLKANGAKATFFLIGQNVGRYPSTVRQIARQGCELGSHSWDHPKMSALSTAAISANMDRTAAAIRSASGQSPAVCRLPYGDGHNSSRVLGALGLPSIYWSLDTRDWANTGNPQHTVNAVLGSVRDGDIVLMHDIHSSSVTAAQTIIPALKKRGFQLVTVSQLARYKGKTQLHAGRTYYNFY